MACSGAEGRQKARRFQHHGARKKGPGGTEESAPEIGRADIVAWRRGARDAFTLWMSVQPILSDLDNWALTRLSCRRAWPAPGGEGPNPCRCAARSLSGGKYLICNTCAAAGMTRDN
jgi:hypothetical protein